MKVLLLNGSPRENGTTFRALLEVSKSLNENGIDTEIVTVGNKEISGCKLCGICKRNDVCADKFVTEIINKINLADGLVVGSPVYYASINGTLKCLLDKVFFAKKSFAYKPAAAVAVAQSHNRQIHGGQTRHGIDRPLARRIL